MLYHTTSYHMGAQLAGLYRPTWRRSRCLKLIIRKVGDDEDKYGLIRGRLFDPIRDPPVRVDESERWICPIATITETIILGGRTTLFEPCERKWAKQDWEL